MGPKNKKTYKSIEEKSTEYKESASVESQDLVMESTDSIAGKECAAVGESMNIDDIQLEQKKSYRKRKKNYYNAIRNQMEFYFGDANLSKDRFLKQLMDQDPFVPLETFLSFNKLKAITTNIKDIAMSLSTSELLVLDDTQQKVRRKTPLAENRNVDEKTLYVEALPSTADHEWVRQIFERFGKVSYISLPKYVKSGKIKEFGFVEFEKEESVHKAVKVFKDFNGVLNMQEKDLSELASVKTYIKEKAGEEEDNVNSSANDDSRKRTLPDIVPENEEPKAKKFKIDDQQTDGISNNEDTGTQSDSGMDVGQKEVDSKKKTKRRKKKSKCGQKLKQKAELNTDVSYYELKILPKKDWKRLRNKYLNLQREKIAELKRKAWRERLELKQQCKDVTKEENCSQTPEKDNPSHKNVKSSKHKLQKINMNFYGAAAEDDMQPKTPTAEKSHRNPAVERAPLFHYEQGLIVEMTFMEPCVNVKDYKNDMRQYASVKYVDVKEGSMQSHLRLEDPEKAKEFVQKVNCAEYQCKILCGEHESMYWQKIERDREQKLNKLVKVPQKRGREKVKKLISKHIRFGDDDE